MGVFDSAMPDSPENNFCTLNPLQISNNDSNFRPSEGSLTLTAANNSGYRNCSGTFSPMGLKGYFEFLVIGTVNFILGIIEDTTYPTNGDYADSSHQGVLLTDGGVVRDTASSIRSASDHDLGTIAVDDVLGVAFDFTGTNRNLWFHRANTYGTASGGVGNPATGANPIATSSNFDSSGDFRFHFGTNTGGAATGLHLNFGQDASFAGEITAGTETDGNGAGVFKYEPPSGFLALCTANITEPLIGANSATQANDHMQAVIYEGDGSVQNIAVNFKPDLTWIKNRDATDPHQLFDSSRGATFPFDVKDSLKGDIANDDTLTDFIATGFTLGDDVAVNTDDESYVSWNWKANGGTSTGSGNESGDNPKFDHQSNTLAGFSIVEYEGTGANGTFAHGVKVNDVATAPDVIWFKHIQGEDTWAMWHHQGVTNASQYIPFGTSNASPQGDDNLWNGGVPSATIINIGVNSLVNRNLGSPSGQGKFICYCFAEIEGYSKFSTYIGNNSTDGTYVNTGFRPSFVLTKINNGGTGNWYLNDTARDPGNITAPLYNDLNSVETGNGIDILSNGFKLRNADASQNGAGVKYLYMAFAEDSFKYANAR